MISTGDTPRALFQRALRLPGEPSSAAAARAVVREVLGEAARPEWVDPAELACSEVVSNVVLHAHTGLELVVEVFEDRVRVQVRDASPVLPVQRDYDRQATTGRGMALVAALTAEHGISDVGPDGKTVWFTVSGSPDDQSEQDLLAAWDDASWDLAELLDEVPVAGGGTDVPVRLLALPPLLWLAARQHHDALVRELVLHLAQHEGGGSAAAGSARAGGGRTGTALADLDGVDVTATDRARSLVSSAVAQALGQGGGSQDLEHPLAAPAPRHVGARLDVPAVLDLELRVPADLGPAYRAMQDTLDAAERLARAGRLLVRPGLPEIVAVRDWVCEQVSAQLAGVAPAPWPGADQERFVVDRTDEQELAERDLEAVRDSPDSLVAANDRNRIVAVSASLAAALGWAADDLVGRRLVALVPPRLREAHVAGFTRHLASGEAHVLGVALSLPVLRRDGSEVLADVLIQQAPTAGGRAVYLARVEPVDPQG